MDNKNKIETPEAYFKRIGVDNSSQSTSSQTTEQSNNVEWEIQQRLKKLKEDRNKDAIQTTDEEILKRLQKIKGEQPTTSDAELQARLANLRGVPIIEGQKKTVLYTPDLRTEQEQADDLMKQYLEHTTIDKQYQEGFKRQLDDIEARIQKLKGGEGVNTKTKDDASSSEDEETVIKKIIEKAKVESSQDDELPAATNDELPFCEICNEDARMRCLGCRYLFCKQCFVEHKDDDDGCNRYELYEAPKNIN
ncbi:abscission/NoCut checkpoint regulator isoform X2 [Ostrinia nubilalis]